VPGPLPEDLAAHPPSREGAGLGGGAEVMALDASLGELVRRLRRREAELLALNATLEARVTQRTDALEQALRELRGFSRMVAHDLRGPLSAVAQLLRLAQAQCDQAGAAAAADLAATGAAECERLGNLVQELLQLAQVDQQPLQRQAVDMRALVEQVWAGLAPPAGRALPALHLGPLPPAQGDPVLLRQVWTNLLANAVKFSAKVGAPQVWVEAQAATPGDLADGGPSPAAQASGADAAGSDVPVGWVYSVRDNGAGFDMAQAARLFTAFERLHVQSDFSGTGLGLSIVQRIVERHGGRVSAQGAVGQGASFRFSLPGAAG
jgi:signal transduction histidine kinase